MTRRYEALTLAPVLASAGSCSRLSETSGVNRRTVYRDAGRPLTIERASLYADAVRRNPSELWSEWVDILETQRKTVEAERRRQSRRRAPLAVRERERAYAREYRAAIKAGHAEQWKANRAAYYKANRDRLLARRRDRYQSDPDYRRQLVERQRAYDQANREAINARKRQRRRQAA